VPVYILWHFEAQESDSNIGVLFSGIFGVLSVATGFIASFYFFVISRGTDFLRGIENTTTFRAMLALAGASLKISIIVIGVSFFVAVIEPTNPQSLFPDVLIVSTWLLLVGLTAANFWRCLAIFIKLAQ
jgi:hypothetical protein